MTALPSAAESRVASPDEPFAYRKIAAEVAARIADGTLRPGDRLPSIRRTSAQWAVSIPTVLQAYRLLEAQRVVAARPKSGFFVLARQPSHRVAEPRAARAAAVAARVTTRDLIVDFLEAVADPRAGHCPMRLSSQPRAWRAYSARSLGATRYGARSSAPHRAPRSCERRSRAGCW